MVLEPCHSVGLRGSLGRIVGRIEIGLKASSGVGLEPF